MRATVRPSLLVVAVAAERALAQCFGWGPIQGLVRAHVLRCACSSAGSLADRGESESAHEFRVAGFGAYAVKPGIDFQEHQPPGVV
jgi:hypothetical protein